MAEGPPPPAPSRKGRGIRCALSRIRVQCVLMLGILLLIWGSIGLQLYVERIATEREAVKDTGNLARAFEENIIRSVNAIDQVILFVRDTYSRDPGHFDLTNWARDRPFLNDQTLQISLMDARGVLIQSNLGPTPTPVDLSDREHFRVHVNSKQDVLFISKPVLGRVSHRYSVQFTRKIVGMEGEFLGVVVVSLDPYYLARFYDSLRIDHGFIMLVGFDGIVRAGSDATQLIGQPLTSSPLLELAARAEDGSYQIARAPMTGAPAFVSYRRVAGYPLVVAVGYGANEVFAPYRLHRLEYMLAGAGLSVFVVSVGLLLARHRRRLARYQGALTATLENMSQGIIMVDRDGQVAVINRRVGELLGLPPHLMREGTSFEAIIRWKTEHGELDPRQYTNISMYERTRPTGTVLEIRTTMLANGGAVRTYTDVTERKRIVEDLAAARDAAEAAGRARSEFLAVMSHEIRTPMNGIIGAAGLLLDRPLGAEELSYVQIIQQSGDHLLQLINDILDFSRLDASRMELEDVPFALRDTIEGAVRMVATTAREKGLALAVTIADDVPRRAVGDASRLRQVLLNLIGNGIKFTARGGVSVAVSCPGQETDGIRLAVAVTDTGIGIPSDALPRLFHEFSQVDGSISRRFGGSGLGLAISRRLVELMGGSMTVESVPGEGSTFRFDVLLKHAPAEVVADVPRPSRDASRRLRVLLVEDNDTNRLVASRMLERMGHRVDAVTDGCQALQAVKSVPYDVILLDLMMPEMDGLTATRAIRREPAPVGLTPIIGLSASAESGKAAECRAAGMNDFVGKPVNAARLAAAIEAVVATEDTPLFDERVLEGLANDIGPDGVVEVVLLFLTEAPRMTERLEQACTGRSRTLLREVHTLASAARSVGLMQLGQAAADIEQCMAREEPGLERLTGLLDLLHPSVARLASWEESQRETVAAAI